MPVFICEDQERQAKEKGTQFVILLANHADDSSSNTDKGKLQQVTYETAPIDFLFLIA